MHAAAPQPVRAVRRQTRVDKTRMRSSGPTVLTVAHRLHALEKVRQVDGTSA